MNADPPPRGILCPRCHCADLRVTKTLRLPQNKIRRYRTCRHCGRRLSTVENTSGQDRRSY